MYTKNFLLDINLWFTCGKSNLWKNLVKLQYIMDKIVATKLTQQNSYVRTSQKSSYFDSYTLKKHYLHLKKGITTDKETTNILFQHLIRKILLILTLSVSHFLFQSFLRSAFSVPFVFIKKIFN